jgi:hypothetical protein
MSFHPLTAPILTLLSGVLILMRPSLLNYVVAVYFIITGILGLASR